MTRYMMPPLLLVLASCGGADPTPTPENSASAAAVNASINNAEEKLEQAENLAETQQ